MQKITVGSRVKIHYANLTGLCGTVVEQCNYKKNVYLVELDETLDLDSASFTVIPLHQDFLVISNEVRYHEIADGEFVFVYANQEEIAVKQHKTGDMVIVKSKIHRTGDVYSQHSAEKMSFIRMNQGDVFKLTK